MSVYNFTLFKYIAGCGAVYLYNVNMNINYYSPFLEKKNRIRLLDDLGKTWIMVSLTVIITIQLLWYSLLLLNIGQID